MKLIFCATLCLILCNFNVDASAIGAATELGKDIARGTINYAKKSIAEQVQADPLLSSIAWFFENGYKKLASNPKDGDKFKFTDLNVDCVYLILEHLDYADLLSMAQVSPQISTVAAAVFRLKFSHLQVEVRDTFEHPDQNKPYELLNVAGVKIDTNTIGWIFQGFGLFDNIEIHEEPDCYIHKLNLKLKNYNKILNTFKHFGHSITKLKMIYTNYFDLQAYFMGDLISKYSSESLVEVEFEYCEENTLEYITKPLINVQNVSFTEHFMIGPTTLAFNELFPAIRRLNLDFSIGGSLNYFDCYMPHLEHVFIKGLSVRSDYSEDSLGNMIMKNPQIRSIELFKTKPKFLDKVNTFLPQLETLKLSNFRLSEGSIEFANVTTFAINFDAGSPINLHFPRLQSLHIVFNERRFYDWLDFLNEHNHLNRLHLEHWDLSDTRFQQLTANLTNLTHMILWHDNDRSQSHALNTAVIVEFMKSHEQLLQLDLINYPKVSEQILQDQLRFEWDIKKIDDGLCFERQIGQSD